MKASIQACGGMIGQKYKVGKNGFGENNQGEIKSLLSVEKKKKSTRRIGN